MCCFVVAAVGIIASSDALCFLAAFLLVMPASARAIGLLSLQQLSARCGPAAPVMAGEEMYLPVEVSNLGLMPRFRLQAQVHLHPALEPSESPANHGARAMMLLPFIPGGGRALHSARVQTSRRGRFQTGPVTLVHMDTLKLSMVSRQVSASYEVVVYPRPLDIAVESILSGDLLGSDRTSRQHASTHGADFFGMRGYQDGDEWRRVHWPTTARTGNLTVVQRETTASLSMVIVLDLAAEAGESSQAPLEALIALAARFAEEAINRLSVLYILGILPDGAITPICQQCTSRLTALEALAGIGHEAAGSAYEITAIPTLVGGGPSLVVLAEKPDSRIRAVADYCKQAGWPGAIILYSSKEPVFTDDSHAPLPDVSQNSAAHIQDLADHRSLRAGQMAAGLPTWRLRLGPEGEAHVLERLSLL